MGTRFPSAPARQYAGWLAARLAEHGVAVLSGGAEGIDRAAHEGALEAGGVTVVVAPSSFDCPYPEAHSELFARIVATGGAYVSPYRRGVKPRRHQFFRRNSLLVALSHAVVIVEAPIRSGARNAGKWARELGRPCFVAPSPPWHANGLGCIAELQLGARPLAGPEDVLRCLREQDLHAVAVSAAPVATDAYPSLPPPTEIGARRLRADDAQSSDSPDPVLQDILDAIEAGCCHPDDIGRAASLGAAEVSHGLLRLTLEGSIVQSPTGEITLARR